MIKADPSAADGVRETQGPEIAATAEASVTPTDHHSVITLDADIATAGGEPAEETPDAAGALLMAVREDSSVFEESEMPKMGTAVATARLDERRIDGSSADVAEQPRTAAKPPDEQEPAVSGALKRTAAPSDVCIAADPGAAGDKDDVLTVTETTAPCCAGGGAAGEERQNEVCDADVAELSRMAAKMREPPDAQAVTRELEPIVTSDAYAGMDGGTGEAQTAIESTGPFGAAEGALWAATVPADPYSTGGAGQARTRVETIEAGTDHVYAHVQTYVYAHVHTHAYTHAHAHVCLSQELPRRAPCCSTGWKG